MEEKLQYEAPSLEVMEITTNATVTSCQTDVSVPGLFTADDKCTRDIIGYCYTTAAELSFGS